MRYVTFLLLLALPAFANEDDARRGPYSYWTQMQFLCEWGKANDADNPVEMGVCTEGIAVDASKLEMDERAWWNNLSERDHVRYEELKPKFDADHQAYVKDLVKKAERARADAQRARIAKRKASIPTMNTDQLCREYRLYKTPEAQVRLRDSKEFPPADMYAINDAKVYIGISEKAMFCVMGPPDDANRSVGSWGVHVQYVYRGRVYIYTQNGKVTSWQD